MFTICGVMGWLMVKDAKARIEKAILQVRVVTVEDDFADVPKVASKGVEKMVESVGDSVVGRMGMVGQ
jgi:hypothetical protein